MLTRLRYCLRSSALQAHPQKGTVSCVDAVVKHRKFMVFGKTGWIGGLLGHLLAAQGEEFVFAESRLQVRGVMPSVLIQQTTNKSHTRFRVT